MPVGSDTKQKRSARVLGPCCRARGNQGSSLIMVFMLLAGPVAARVRPAATDTPTWPAPPDPPRARFVAEYRSTRDLGGSGSPIGRVLRGLAGAKRKDQITLVRPTDIWAVDSTRFFVTDASASALYVFDTRSRSTKRIGAEGAGALAKPMGLGGDSLGQVYVADPPNRRVVVFDSAGRYVRAMGGEHELLNPVDVAVESGTGRAWVVDSHLHQIVIFDAAGGVWKRIGRDSTRGGAAESEWHDPVVGHGARGTERGAHDARENRGSADGEFLYPSSITLSPAGRVFVSDGLNGRVQSFDLQGTHLSSFGRLGDTPGSLPRPKGIACDSQGHVWVVDAAFNNVQVFDESGALMLSIGGLGQEHGRFWLPMGVHIDRADRVYIADRYNGRIQVLRYLPQVHRVGSGPDAESDSSAAREHEGGLR